VWKTVRIGFLIVEEPVRYFGEYICFRTPAGVGAEKMARRQLHQRQQARGKAAFKGVNGTHPSERAKGFLRPQTHRKWKESQGQHAVPTRLEGIAKKKDKQAHPSSWAGLKLQRGQQS